METASKIMGEPTGVENPVHYLSNKGIDIVLLENGRVSSDPFVFNVKTYVEEGSLFKQVILSPVSHQDPRSFEFRYNGQNDRTRLLPNPSSSYINFIGRDDEGHSVIEFIPPRNAAIRYKILGINHRDPNGYRMFDPESSTAFSYDPKKRLFTPLNYDSEFPADLSLREPHII